MKNTKALPVAATVVLAALSAVVDARILAAAPGATAGANPKASAASHARVARGKYLVAIMGCNDCHTPLKMTDKGPEPDMSRMLSGHPQDLKMPAAPAASGPWMWQGAVTNTAFAGPWGVSYAANLTPDVNTGLGIWTEEMFVKAIRTGKHFGVSRPIQPPMPWATFRNASDEDLKAIYAYLRSIPPAKNLVPDYQPPAPASVNASR
jgi:mono/diheme cytochrome c family protein